MSALSDFEIAVDRGGEQVIVGVGNGETTLAAALHDRADETTVEDVLKTAGQLRILAEFLE